MISLSDPYRILYYGNRGVGFYAKAKVTSPRLQIAIEGRDGLFIRSVSESTPLPDSDTHGHSAEVAVVKAMSHWGLPDFAFRGSTVALGSGVREVGDGLLITYPFAAVIQVKARKELSDDPEKEIRWLIKYIEKADRQVAGTLRRLRLASHAATNIRGVTIPVVANEHEWVGIVILEHDQIPDDFIPPRLSQNGIVLTRSDWEFLWQQLQSTVEVLRYIHRVGMRDPIPLNQEAVKYYQAAMLDEDTEPEPLSQAWIDMGGIRVNGPQLPLAPAGMVVEHYVIRQIMENLARAEMPEDLEPKRLLRAFSALDGISVSQRDQLGCDLMLNLWTDADDPRNPRLWSRTIRSPIPNTPQIIFATTSHDFDKFIQGWLSLKVEFTHDVWLKSGTYNCSNLTVGILLSRCATPPKPFDVTLVSMNTLELLTDEEHELVKKGLSSFWGND